MCRDSPRCFLGKEKGEQRDQVFPCCPVDVYRVGEIGENSGVFQSGRRREVWSAGQGRSGGHFPQKLPLPLRKTAFPLADARGLSITSTAI